MTIGKLLRNACWRGLLRGWACGIAVGILDGIGILVILGASAIIAHSFSDVLVAIGMALFVAIIGSLFALAFFGGLGLSGGFLLGIFIQSRLLQEADWKTYRFFTAAVTAIYSLIATMFTTWMFIGSLRGDMAETSCGPSTCPIPFSLFVFLPSLVACIAGIIIGRDIASWYERQVRGAKQNAKL